MQAKRLTLFVAVIASLAAVPMVYPVTAFAADAATIQPRDGWYNKALVDYDFMRQNVSIPPKKGVVIIDSRPAARQYDPGHIPGAINIPDSQFDKLVDKLPADKATLLLFYCGGLECMLSHNSAFKAEKLGYTNIKVYPAGSPEWKAKGAQMSVSAAYLKKLMEDKAPYVLIDARPKRVADKGMIPTALNISDTEFDKQVDKLPADKATPLIYYCGGLECVLSDNSAAKAKKLGYTNVLTYPPGYPGVGEAAWRAGRRQAPPQVQRPPRQPTLPRWCRARRKARSRSTPSSRSGSRIPARSCWSMCVIRRKSPPA
jgi:rhodanese-related sulfurtransferase